MTKKQKQKEVEQVKKKVEEGLENVNEELEECKKLKDEYLDSWKRERADFINYKKEETEIVQGAVDFVKSELILKILKILDNLERAKKEIPSNLKNNDFLNGIFQIENQMKDILKEEKVEEIKTENKEFNPNFHEAVECVEENNKESGIIIKVLEKGYMLSNRVLRPVKVKISK